MKISTLFLLLACSLFVSSVAAQSSVPSIEVKRVNGESVNIHDYVTTSDKLTIISFWATWCSPCKKELDAIADFYEEWQEDYNVELIAVSIDTRRTSAKVSPMVESKSWEYTIFCDPNEQLRQAMNVQSVPHTFIVNSSGEVLWSHSSYVPGDEYELEDQIKAINSNNQ